MCNHEHKERLAILNKFGGRVQNDLASNGHHALPNNRAQYIMDRGWMEQIDPRMTGWGYTDELAIEFLYENIKTLLWNMVKMIE